MTACWLPPNADSLPTKSTLIFIHASTSIAPLPETMCSRSNPTPLLMIGSGMGAKTQCWPVRSGELVGSI